MADEHSPLDLDDVTVVVAMSHEERPVRRLVPELRIVHAGIGLAALHEPLTSVVLSAGVAGGLDPELDSGTVVIPREVAREDGKLLPCDVAWSAALERASIRLGFPTVTMPLLSAGAVVTHASRAAWFEKGFAAVDMETALLAEMVPRIAAVRVILDTPNHEISPAWIRPRRAAVNPIHWAEVVWIVRKLPRYTKRVGLVIAAALEEVGQ